MLTLKYKQKIGYRVRTIAKQNILFGGDLKAYQLNETGNYIWNQLDGMTNVKEIVFNMSADFNRSEKELEHDVLEFILFLKSIDAIKEI